MEADDMPHPEPEQDSSVTTGNLPEPPLEAPREAHTDSLDIVICAAAFFLFTHPIFKSLMERLDLSPLFLYLPFVPATGWAWHNRRRRQDRAILIAKYQFPSTIRERIRKRYPHLLDEDLWLVMQGLRQYFQLCNNSGRNSVSMPSRVVDIAWHEFILMTRAYEQFCRSAMGRFLHHTPASEMRSLAPIEEGLRKAWQLACEWENINQKSPSRLPFLFAIDTALKIPDGFMHTLDNRYGAICRTGGDGGRHGDEGDGGGCGCDGCG